MVIFNKFESFLLIFILFINLFFLIYLFNPELTSNVVKGEITYSEINSPFDFIKEEHISIQEKGILININNTTISKYSNSNSMIPVLNSNSTGISIKPESEGDIHIGDIICFYLDEEFITHRVVEKGIDDIGVYFVTKGDNNLMRDKKIRFEDIDSILVAILY
jgi:hypothetical protein